MNILQPIADELIRFMNLGELMKMYHSGDYSSLATTAGVFSAISPLIPLLLLIEVVRALLYKRFKIEDWRNPFFTIVINRVIGLFLTIAVTGWLIGHLSKYAILHSSFTWYWLIYGYIIWEFSHFIYHYFGHKVRLFWCLHSTHHAPETMNMSVTYMHFFLEGFYADMIRVSICILMGVDPLLLFFIMGIDGTWGAFIHVSEHTMKNARLGFLGKIILTPSHHRVHHARNPLYMDTNFCNLLNIWDRVFKTYQPEKTDLKIEYGITRPVNTKNFFDVYFGEFVCLFRDMQNAPGLKNKILYMFMPPGWSHTGDHKTARVVKSSVSPTHVQESFS